jgi:hypothetical protein
MDSITVSLIIFVCVFAGALLGILLRAVLPEHHLSKETQDIVKLGWGWWEPLPRSSSAC